MIKLYWTTNMSMGSNNEIEGSVIGAFKTREASVRAARTWLETHQIVPAPYTRMCYDSRGREWEDYGSWSHFFVREEIQFNDFEIE